MQNGCQFHIKFHEESKNELYFNRRSYAMKAEVKAEFNFEPSFITGITGLTDYTSLLVFMYCLLSFIGANN